MTSRRQKIQCIEKAFAEIHASTPEPQLSPMWRQSVMKNIRLQKARKSLLEHTSNSTAFTNLMFRFAGAGTAVGLALLLYTIEASTALDTEALRAIIQDPLSVLPIENLFWS